MDTTLPSKVQLGDPVIFQMNESQSSHAHVQAIKFTSGGEVLYDLDVYPVKDRWTEFHLRLPDIPSAFVIEIKTEDKDKSSITEPKSDLEDWIAS